MFVICDVSKDTLREAFKDQPSGSFFFVSFEKSDNAWSLAVKHVEGVRFHKISFKVCNIVKDFLLFASLEICKLIRKIVCHINEVT